MFCSQCGTRVGSTYRFCGKCGNSILSTNNLVDSAPPTSAPPTSAPQPTPPTSAPSTSPALPPYAPSPSAYVDRPGPSTYSQFQSTSSHMERKRQLAFNTGKNKKKPTPTRLRPPPSIQIGVASRTDDGFIKRMRGRQNVTCREEFTAPEVLQAGVNKWADHDQSFCGLDTYVLLYPDFMEVQKLRNTDAPFRLCDYKTELAKPYSQLVFYLCLLSDFQCSPPPPAEVITIKDEDVKDEKDKEEEEADDLFDVPFMMLTSTPVRSSTISTTSRTPTPLLTTPLVTTPTPITIITTNATTTDATSEANNSTTDTTTDDTTASTTAASTEAATTIASSSNATTEATTSLFDVFEVLDSDLPPIQQSYDEKLANLRQVLPGNDEKLDIRRNHVFTDTVRKFKRKFKQGPAVFKVDFHNEPAADEGGPLREFFTLFFEQSKLLLVGCGMSGSYTFIHDVSRLKNEEYKIYGYFVALAIIMGCPGPRYFMPCVVQKLLDLPPIQPSLQDIPDAEIMEKVREIGEADDTTTFQNLLNEFPERFWLGVTQPTIEHSQRQQIVSDVATHYCLSVCSEEILQMKEGLDILGLRRILVEHEEGQKELLPRQYPTALELCDFLEAGIEYSDNVQLKKTESDIIYYLKDFIEFIGDTPIVVKDVLELSEKDLGSSNLMGIDYSTKELGVVDVVQWLTGSRHLQPSMKAKIIFQHGQPVPEDKEGETQKERQRKGRRITSHTCSFTLEIPVNRRYITSAELFTIHLCEDITSSAMFALA